MALRISNIEFRNCTTAWQIISSISGEDQTDSSLSIVFSVSWFGFTDCGGGLAGVPGNDRVSFVFFLESFQLLRVLFRLLADLCVVVLAVDGLHCLFLGGLI